MDNYQKEAARRRGADSNYHQRAMAIKYFMEQDILQNFTINEYKKQVPVVL